MRELRPARQLPPPAPTIPVSRQFVRDFNRIDTFYDWNEAQRRAFKARVRSSHAMFSDVQRLARVLRAPDVVARHYGWSEVECAEWRVPLARPGTARDYIATLAMALQHGYRHTPANDYMRLNVWLAAHGFDPIDTCKETNDADI